MNKKEEFEEKFFTEMEFPNNEKIPVKFTAERRELLWQWIENEIKEARIEELGELLSHYQAHPTNVDVQNTIRERNGEDIIMVIEVPDIKNRIKQLKEKK